VPAVSSEHPGHVLEEHVGSCAHSANLICEVIEEPSFVGGSGTPAGLGYGLAGQAADQEVDGGENFAVRPAAKVGDAGVPVLEQRRAVVVVVGDEHELVFADHVESQL